MDALIPDAERLTRQLDQKIAEDRAVVEAMIAMFGLPPEADAFARIWLNTEFELSL